MMNCVENGLRIGGIWHVFFPPDENQARGQLDYIKEKGDKTPRKRPGDRYPIVGALVGVIAGFSLSIGTGHFMIIALSAIGGGIVGTMIGSFIGNLVRKYKKSREDRMSGI